MTVSSVTQSAAKHKARNMRFYQKKGTTSFLFITRHYHDDNNHHYDNNNHDDDNVGNCGGGSLVNLCKWCSSYAGGFKDGEDAVR